MWRRPTLTVRLRTTTIGSAGLNFRVRDENGWVPCDMITTMVECLCTFRLFPSAHTLTTE